MIPTIGLKVIKEEAKKEQKSIRILRKGDRPDEVSSDSDEDVDDNNLNNEKQRKKPGRIIQKSCVINDDNPVMSKREILKNKLMTQSLINSLASEPKIHDNININHEHNINDNEDNELLNFIHDDNENQCNTIIKEDVIEITAFNMPSIHHSEPLKPQIKYESEREKQLMEKYVLESNDSDSSSENNSQLESTQNLHHPPIKPIFLSKRSLATNSKEILSDLEQEANKAIKLKQQDTSKILQSYIEKESQSNNQPIDENNIALPDDTDDMDDIAEYEQWKIRELKRIKRQIEEAEEKIKSKIEIERRRNMTDEERRDENIKLGSDDTLRTFKSKINYLQKYYHKGAYFQDNASGNTQHIYNRDFNLPTWEDKVDRSAFGELFEKRRGNMFKKGQTKYTHLTKEDTTNFDPAFKIPEQIASNLLNKSAALKSKNNFNKKY